MKKSIQFEVLITNLNERGYGVGHATLNNNSYNVYVLGALEGEKVLVETFKKKNGDIYAHVIEVLIKSPDRMEAKENDHYFACSPWQILDNNKELEVKKNQILQLFNNFEDSSFNEFEVIQSPNLWNYRNKVEFGFFEDWDSGKISLSFFKREGNKGRYCIDGCELMPQIVNEIAFKIIEIINKEKISSKLLKHLLIRYSFYEKKAVINLYVKDKEIFFNDEFNYKNVFSDLAKNNDVKSFSVIYSNPLSPASVNSGILFNTNDDVLTEKFGKTLLSYDSESFFQINPDAFGLLIEDLKLWFDKNNTSYNINNLTLLDLYSGVGTIGLCLADKFKSIIGVELSFNSKKQSEFNAKQNLISNAVFIETAAEDAINYITSDKIVLVDPPRIGLHEKVIKKLIDQTPQLIIYVSCNPSTQARDYNLLKEKYKIIYQKGFNFYPHTPHCENLIILEKLF